MRNEALLLTAPLLLLIPHSTGLAPSTSLPQRVLNAVLESPLYDAVLVPQARRTMVKTAEENGIAWGPALEWIQRSSRWTDRELAQWVPLDFEYPWYYRKKFHAYEMGNLCWDAAHEQELAGKAVGQRNFPGNGPGAAGEDAFRDAFVQALENELGAGESAFSSRDELRSHLIVDMGCGTGTSTRRLARRFPGSEFRFVGIDLSPHFLSVADFLQSKNKPQVRQEHRSMARMGVGSEGIWRPDTSTELAEQWVENIVNDDRIKFVHGDIAPPALNSRDDSPASQNLPEGCASVVNIDLVIHELPPSASKQAFYEAKRLLRKPSPETSDLGGELWICEMDFATPGYRKLRSNPLLFSLIRATEPFLDEYAEYQAGGTVGEQSGLLRDLRDAGFQDIRIAAATGRHFALVARLGSSSVDGNGVVDMRFDAQGRHLKKDTHLKTWESKKAASPTDAN